MVWTAQQLALQAGRKWVVINEPSLRDRGANIGLRIVAKWHNDGTYSKTTAYEGGSK